jgi:hypothetical protein
MIADDIMAFGFRSRDVNMCQAGLQAPPFCETADDGSSRHDDDNNMNSK